MKMGQRSVATLLQGGSKCNFNLGKGEKECVAILLQVGVADLIHYTTGRHQLEDELVRRGCKL
jgi:hypothetical protein